jgi:UPF0755 protein
MEENLYLAEEKAKPKWFKYIVVVLVFFLVLFGIGSFLFLNPPSRFPVNKTFTIEKGHTLKTVSLNLKKEKIIKSAVAFQTISILVGDETSIKAGDYLFEKPIGLFDVARRILIGESGINSNKVTIPEGVTNREISSILSKNIPNFDQPKFLIAAQGKEGYLFPDTYFFFPNTDPKVIVDALAGNFNKKIEEYKEQIEASGKTTKDIIIMASILEREAFGEKDIYTISGILWSRIEKGIPLQADATITYITGRGSSEITLSDLAIDSRWNTYKYKGLPIAPIGNPGIRAIDAALNPEETDYLYYLHDADGVAHYGRTFDEHKKNKSLYLN